MSAKNLLFLHLESIAWQTFNAFTEAFPNLARFMPSARVFRSYYSSATSTQMVLAYLLHANDYELDTAHGLDRPARNNPSLFAILRDAGYATDFLCASAFETKPMLPLLTDSLPPVWRTSDYSALLRHFETRTTARPFAAYVWNLVTHVEHAVALAPDVRGLHELVAGACAVADHVLGELLASLERRNLLNDTVIVVFGDHGEDFWTHGFKMGTLHGLEPYTHLLHAPLLVRDSALEAGNDHRLVSTIDLAPLCLDLLDIGAALPFAESGRSPLRGPARDCVFAQNFTANQGDNWEWGIRKCFAAIDRSYVLNTSSRGLELFNHRLDPGNHSNLLHLFERAEDGALVLRAPAGHRHPHFDAAVAPMLTEDRSMAEDFQRLRSALRGHVAKKAAYVAERVAPPHHLLDAAALDTISRHGRARFFAVGEAALNDDRPPGFGPLPVAAHAADPPSLPRQASRSYLGAIVDAVLRRGGGRP